jgi:hypothetical protein
VPTALGPPVHGHAFASVLVMVAAPVPSSSCGSEPRLGPESEIPFIDGRCQCHPA